MLRVGRAYDKLRPKCYWRLFGAFRISFVESEQTDGVPVLGAVRATRDCIGPELIASDARCSMGFVIRADAIQDRGSR